MTAELVAPGAVISAPDAPFVNALRVRPGLLHTAASDGGLGAPVLAIRVEMPEVWDAVAIDAPATAAVRAVKDAALGALSPDAAFPEEFVMKLRGMEIRDESASLSQIGARNGSIFLLTYRRRRPVRD